LYVSVWFYAVRWERSSRFNLPNLGLCRVLHPCSPDLEVEAVNEGGWPTTPSISMWSVATYPCGVKVLSRFFRSTAVARRSEATHRSVHQKGREEDPKMQQVGVHPRWLMFGCRLKMLAGSNSLALTLLHHVFLNLHQMPSRGLAVAPHFLRPRRW
jgi:hypothetical protein